MRPFPFFLGLFLLYLFSPLVAFPFSRHQQYHTHLVLNFFFFFRRCVKLDGRMSPANRAAVIEAFNTKPEITVFLISLKV